MVDSASLPISRGSEPETGNAIERFVGFSAEDFERISQCFERMTGRAAWVGFGFAGTQTGASTTIHLFSAGAEGGRMTLSRARNGTYALFDHRGRKLWSGRVLREFTKGLQNSGG